MAGARGRIVKTTVKTIRKGGKTLLRVTLRNAR